MCAAADHKEAEVCCRNMAVVDAVVVVVVVKLAALVTARDDKDKAPLVRGLYLLNLALLLVFHVDSRFDSECFVEPNFVVGNSKRRKQRLY